ncbi:MAG: hypothetical protein HYX74_06015 [Acidobacteria bacterium]|nr:hypothetical protein [Acidobacteriota bacterium]
MAKNGNSLQQAMALLVNNQAAFVAQLNETNKRQAKIEQDLEQIKAILVQHSQILAGLPEAIRQKVGFKAGR